ncbi:MAG: hypothetical protein Q8O43_07690 [Dehalococcoidia bacterium]|nr:hypothetical protein [Dehalococcoidia bacterium]
MLNIEIVTDKNQPACAENCGTDWSQPEALANVREQLLKLFGNRVRLKHTIVSNAEDHRRRLGKSPGFPLLLANGEVRLSGQFDLRQVIDIAQTQLEMGVPIHE